MCGFDPTLLFLIGLLVGHPANTTAPAAPGAASPALIQFCNPAFGICGVQACLMRPLGPFFLLLLSILALQKVISMIIGENIASLLSSRLVPSLIVFDLDHCLWLPEMYTLEQVPDATCTVIGNLDKGGLVGVAGVRSGYETIKLFPDALTILRDIYNGEYGNEVKIAAASSADTPLAVRIGKAAMGLLEILPGVTMRQVFNRNWPENFEGHLQIGRSPPLSSNKAEAHFPILKRETGIGYDQMIFFDDCLWGDHVGNVERLCPGVIAQRTPRGLTTRDWNIALTRYQKSKTKGQPPL